VDNRTPLPVRDRQADPAFSESLADLTVLPYSPLWRMSQPGLRASLSGRRNRGPIIWHARNNISSNKVLVSASLPVQFLRGYRWGYDREH
jgi:hypothetical protein